jgi:hypothetical protein
MDLGNTKNSQFQKQVPAVRLWVVKGLRTLVDLRENPRELVK